MYKNQPNFLAAIGRRPTAIADIHGSESHSNIRGTVKFYQTAYGVLVVTQVMGLESDGGCASPIFAMHIHDGSECTGNKNDPFANAGMHHNPKKCAHPYHAGDMPPLFGTEGIAFSVFLTDRFEVWQVLDRTVIIHSAVDDFTTQPSGNAGEKIACGKILAARQNGKRQKMSEKRQ